MADSDSDDFVVLDQNEIQEYDGAGLRPQSPATLQKILDWLEPTAYDDGTSEYARHLTSHLRGTGDWLAETEEYCRWHDGRDANSHLLWIKAAPGTGKSVIAAHQRAHLATSERAIVLYFFFRYIITTNRTPKQLVRDWIAQLLPFSPALQKRLKEEYLDQRKLLANVTFEDLWDHFRSACKTQSRIYCFVDALDEMGLGHDDLFTHLLRLSDVPACKVFATSRPIPRIVAILRNTSAITVTLGPDNMSEDISTYVDHRIEKDMARYIDHRLDLHDANLGDDETRAAVKPLIQSVLQEKAQGSFLYSKLMLDNVLEALRGMNEHVSIDKVRRVLQDLPTGLAGMYSDMLRDHARRTGTSPELQQNILRWVTHSERPLRMLELATVLESVKTDSKGLTPADTKALVRTACGPLLEIMPSDVVGPVHHSFTEYLISPANSGNGIRNDDFIDSKSTHRYILEQCLKYLLQLDPPKLEISDDRNDSFGIPANENDDLKLKYPFFEYATTNWPSHARKCGRLDPPILQLLDQLLDKSREIRRIWIRMKIKVNLSSRYFTHGRRSEEPPWSDTVTPLHVAASVGLPDYVEHLIGLGADVNASTSMHTAPLLYAASSGRTSTLDALLNAGADPLRTDRTDACALVLAAAAGHAECVNRLLLSVPTWGQRSSGNRLDSSWHRRTVREEALASAKLKKSELRSGVIANAQVSGGGENDDDAGENHLEVEAETMLIESVRQAVMHRQGTTIGIFLDYLSPDEMIEVLCQALQRREGSEISLVVVNHPRFDVDRSGTDPSARTIRSPISIAVSHANLACVRALLQRGAQPIASPNDSEAESLLHTLIPSIDQGRGVPAEDIASIVELLVEAGVPVDKVNAQGKTPLYRARANHAVAGTLLRLGADVTTAAGGDSTPLHDIAGDSEEGMRFWIRYGFDINARNARGETPLHAALSGHPRSGDMTRSVRTLLALGADPNLHSPSGLTPLHMCHSKIMYGDQEAQLYKVLLDAGADPNACDLNGMTPLMTLHLHPNAGQAARMAYKALIASGANPAARNVLGENMFLVNIRRAWYCHGDAKLGPQWNGDLHAVNNNGSNAALLSCRYPQGLAQLNDLIESGLDFKTTDCFGNTVLHNMALVQRPRGQRGKEIEDDVFLSMLERLVKMGIDIGRKNLQGQTPLHFAVISGESTMIEWLLRAPEQREKISEADIRGITALHIAACISAKRVLSLIDRGADPLRLTKTGQSTLHFAAVARKGNVISVLLACTEAKQRAFVNLTDGSGRTALHYAARSGRHEIVKLLLDAGADPNIRDHEQRAPLNFCADLKKEEDAWKIARENVHGRQGPFIRTESNDYHVKELEKNTFDFAPATMTRSWESMARDLYVARAERPYDSDPKKPSARLCVKYLLSSGAENVLPEKLPFQPNMTVKFGGTDWSPKSAILDAIATDGGCNAMLGELLRTLEAEEGAVERLHDTLQYSDGSMRIATYRNKDAYLQSVAKSDESIKDPRHAVDMLMSEDRADLAVAFYLASQHGTKEDDWTRSWHVEEFISGGQSDALVLYVQEFGQPDLTDYDSTLASWPRSLQDLPASEPSYGCVRGGKPLEPEPGYKWDHELLTGPITGALLKTCQRTMPNHEVVRVLMKEGNISQREKLFALAGMVTSPSPWNLETIEYLIRDGADINAQDPKGITPLMRACHNTGTKHPLKRRVVELLLRLGADVSILDKKHRSCLDFTYDSRTIRLLLEHGAAAQGEGVRGVLLMAVQSHKVDLIRLLMKHGLDLKEFETEEGKRVDNTKAVDDDWDDLDGPAPETMAQQGPSPPVLSLLNKMYGSYSRWYHDKSPRTNETAGVLLDGGADPFGPSEDTGITALHRILADSHDVTEILTRPGLDLERRDRKGRTLLLAAADTGGDGRRWETTGENRGWLANVEALLKLNVDLRATDNEGRNIIHYCIDGPGMMDTVRKILDKPGLASLVNARDNNGQRPIQLAIAHYRWRQAEMLMEYGADLTIVGPDGKSAFHHLLPLVNTPRYGRITYEVTPLIEKLLSHIEAGPDWEKHASLPPLAEGEKRCIDINAYDKDGEPPLFALMRQNLQKVIDLRSLLAADHAGTYVKPEAKPTDEPKGSLEAPRLDGGTDEPAVAVSEPAPDTEDSEPEETRRKKMIANKKMEKQLLKKQGDPSIHDVFPLLRRAGLTLHVKSRDGRGALHAFASYKRPHSFGHRPSDEGELIRKMWEALVAAGLDPYAEDNEQRSALDVAAACGNLEILE